MSVSSTTNQVIYTGSGTTGPFDFTFKIFVNTDLLVQKYTIASDTSTDLVLTTDYTVTINGDLGGTVTLTASLSSSYKLVITRQLPMTQAINYVPNDPFPAETHEEGLDRAAMRDQQLQEQLDRCVQVVAGSSTSPATLIASLIAASDAAVAAAAAASTGAWSTSVVSIKTGNYTLVSGDFSKLMIMNSASPFAFTLPDIALNAVVILKNIGAGLLTITPHASDTCDVASLLTNQSVVLIADTTNNKWRETARNGGSAVVRGTFTNASLSAGVLTITHNAALASPYSPLVQIFNNSGVQIVPDQVNTLAANSFKVDLTSYGTLSGTWSYAYSI